MTAELTQAIPGPNHPFVDRYRNVTSVWYPWLVKILDFVNGIARGELLVDGAITSRTLATGAITADAIAAGAITADAVGTNMIVATEANIANASVTTLKIAGEAVIIPTSYQSAVEVPTSAYTRAQMLTGNNNWTEVAAVTVSVPVTSKYIILWTAKHNYRKHIRTFVATDTITYGVDRYDNPHALRFKIALDGGAPTIIDTVSALSVSDYVSRTNTGTITVSSAAVSLRVTAEWCGYYDAADEYVAIGDRTLVLWVAKR